MGNALYVLLGGVGAGVGKGGGRAGGEGREEKEARGEEKDVRHQEFYWLYITSTWRVSMAIT